MWSAGLSFLPSSYLQSGSEGENPQGFLSSPGSSSAFTCSSTDISARQDSSWFPKNDLERNFSIPPDPKKSGRTGARSLLPGQTHPFMQRRNRGGRRAGLPGDSGPRPHSGSRPRDAPPWRGEGVAYPPFPLAPPSAPRASLCHRPWPALGCTVGKCSTYLSPLPALQSLRERDDYDPVLHSHKRFGPRCFLPRERSSVKIAPGCL